MTKTHPNLKERIERFASRYDTVNTREIFEHLYDEFKRPPTMYQLGVILSRMPSMSKQKEIDVWTTAMGRRQRYAVWVHQVVE